MYETLPSYAEATDRDYWSVIASFVRSADLCAAALVCRKWNAIFSPLLWGNPASHFGTENDAVYVALVRFKRTLRWARYTTRELTHTLHFPPAQAEIYGGPRAEWLSDILHRLPCLQSLIVADLPFFDHAALSSIVKLSQPDLVRGTLGTTYQLRLLDASYCNNITPQALAAALGSFPALTYLDLSRTTSARYVNVLSSLALLPALQILKLQGLTLNDDDMAVLTKAVGRRLRSLDIRKNRITDRGIQLLIQNCIREDSDLTNRSPSPSRPNTKLARILESNSQDDFVRAQLTTGFVVYLGIEAEAGHGITHLYASSNNVTISGASALVKCKQMRVLDLGDLTAGQVAKAPPRSTPAPLKLSLPRAEKLISLMEDYSHKLTYVRVNHAVVTELASLKEARTFEMEDTSDVGRLQHFAELESNERHVYEMHGAQINELPGIEPVYAELEGSPVPSSPPDTPQSLSPQIQISSASSRPPADLAPVAVASPLVDSTGGLFSPVSPMSPHGRHTLDHEPEDNVRHTVSISAMAPQVLTPPADLEVNHQATNGSDLLHPARSQTHRRTYSGVLDEHESQLRYRQSQDHALLPGTVRNLRTLVLTDMPSTSSTPNTHKRLIEFITQCADEERWASLQASVGYELPPGPDRRSAERQYASSLFALRKLVLEMAPPKQRQDSGWGRTRSPSSPTMLSSTNDPDCETYLNAGKDDFSFFGDEECGQPDVEGLAPIPIANFTEKMMLVPGGDTNGRVSGGGPVKEQVYDVLAEVSKFRKAKKAEHEAALAAGNMEHVHGYWSGVIEIVRPR